MLERAATRSQTTAVNHLMALRSFFAFALATRRRRDDPTAGLSLRRPKLDAPVPYLDGDVRRIVAAASAPRERALILYAIGSAARRSEIVALRTEHIDWSTATVLIPMGKGAKARHVSPGRSALVALKRYIGARRGPVWLNDLDEPMTDQRAYKLLKRLGERAGVAVTFHRFRVTTANLLSKAGMSLDELQEVLGHARIETTAHYVAYTRRERALRKQHELSPADRVA